MYPLFVFNMIVPPIYWRWSSVEDARNNYKADYIRMQHQSY